MFWHGFGTCLSDSEDNRKDRTNRNECEKRNELIPQEKVSRRNYTVFCNSQMMFHSSNLSFTSEQVSYKYNQIMIGVFYRLVGAVCCFQSFSELF